MARRTVTVGELAASAGLEVDTVLVALWGAGIEHPDSASSRLSDPERRRAQAVIGVAGEHQRRIAYWLDWLGIDRDELVTILEVRGFSLDPRARNVPKNAVRYLRTIPALGEPAIVKDKVESEVVVPAPEFPRAPTGVLLRYLIAEDVVAIHRALEEDFYKSDDPISPPGLRDRGLLEGAVARHTTKYGDIWKYGTVELAGAALLHGIVNNHPFHNGNKRTALVALLVFLDKNGRLMDASQEELFREMIKIAAHELLDEGPRYVARADHEVIHIGGWIARRSRAIRRDERTVPWRVLRALLRDHGCEIEEGKGQKARITRIVTESRGRGVFRRTSDRTLHTTYINTGDGRDVPRSQLRRLREDLWLDESHGVDSELFYVETRQPDDFIQQYSKILRRLARV